MEEGSNRMNIDFYPFLELAKFHPPKPVKHRLPEWYKNTPVYGEHFNSLLDFQEKVNNDDNFKDYNSPFTIKKCIPVLDYLTSGYLFFHLTDSYIEVIDINGIQGFNWKTPSREAGILYSGHNH